MKLLNRFYSFVVVALSLMQLQSAVCMEGGDWVIGDDDIITIQTIDNKEVKLPAKLVKQSITLLHLIEDTIKTEEDVHTIIPVPNLAEADWKELEPLLKIVVDESGQEKEKIFNVLNKKDIVHLSTIINNVNYLDMPIILQQAIKAIAERIQTSSQLVLTKNQIKKLSPEIDFKTWEYAQNVIVLDIPPAIERLVADEIFPYFVKLGEIAEDIVKAWRPQKVATVKFGDKDIKIYDNANQETTLIELPNEIQGQASGAQLSPSGTEVVIVTRGYGNKILVMELETKNIEYLTVFNGGNVPVTPNRYLNNYNFIWSGDGNIIFIAGNSVWNSSILLEGYLRKTNFVRSLPGSLSDIVASQNAIPLLASDRKGQYLLMGIQKYNYPSVNHFLALIELWQNINGKQKKLFIFPIHDLLEDLIWNPNDKSFAAKINGIYYEYTFQPYIFEAQWLYQERHLSDYKSFDKEKIYQSFQKLLKGKEKPVDQSEPSPEPIETTLLNALQNLTRQLISLKDAL